MELAATQAASPVLGHKSGRSSHVLEYHYAWDYVKLMQAAARGDIMGGSPDSVDGDIGADRDADGDISSARTTFGGGDHDVVGSDHGADYAVDIVGDSAAGVSLGGGGRDVSTYVASLPEGVRGVQQCDCAVSDNEGGAGNLFEDYAAADGDCGVKVVDAEDGTGGRKVGMAGVYKDATGKPTPATDASFYFYRNVELEAFNAIEFDLAFKLSASVEQKWLNFLLSFNVNLVVLAGPGCGGRSTRTICWHRVMSWCERLNGGYLLLQATPLPG